MFTNYKNINLYFTELLSGLNCRQDTQSYIIGIFGKYKLTELDLTQNSITLLFSYARNNGDFATYQKIADFVFMCNSLMPESLNNASKEYYDTIAKLSYYSCFKLINKQWHCFEELADNFNILENQVKNKLQHIKISK